MAFSGFLWLSLAFSSLPYAASQPELASYINTDPNREIREKANLGFGESALIDSEVIRLDFSLFDQKNPTPDSLIPGQSFRLRLPGEKRSNLFQIESVQEHVPGVFTYTGHIESSHGLPSNRNQDLNSDDSYTWFSFSVQGEELLGKINRGGYVYVIQKDNNSSDDYIVSKIDPGKIPQDPDFDDGHITENSGSRINLSTADSLIQPVMSAASSDDGSRNIRVYFLFTDDVDLPHQRASEVISEFRHALSNSGISLPHRYITFAGLRYAGGNTSAYTCQTNSPDTLTRSKIMFAMGDAHHNETPLPNKPAGSPIPGNAFNGIRTWMAAAKADIAFLIYRGNNPGVDDDRCRVGGRAEIFDPTRPVGVVADNYASSDLTAVHEIGHIFNARHPDDTEPPNGNLGNHGFIEAIGSFQTIMGGYSAACGFVQTHNGGFQTCPRISHFSDPTDTELFPGILASQNMVAFINNPENTSNPSGFADVAGWGVGTSGSPPLAPHPLTLANTRWCFYKIAQMTSQPSATYYELYTSQNSNFSNSSLIYSGASTSRWLLQRQSISYYKAKACNANGCGNFTPPVSATAC